VIGGNRYKLAEGSRQGKKCGRD